MRTATKYLTRVAQREGTLLVTRKWCESNPDMCRKRDRKCRRRSRPDSTRYIRKENRKKERDLKVIPVTLNDHTIGLPRTNHPAVALGTTFPIPNVGVKGML